MISGTVACNSSGADFGLVMSAITNFDRPANSRTVPVKSFVSGLSPISSPGRDRGTVGGAWPGRSLMWMRPGHPGQSFVRPRVNVGERQPACIRRLERLANG